MAIYAIGLQPLITRLGISSDAKQCWYADDASGPGSLEAIKQWWDELTEAGPNLGYYPNAKKCWIITKPEKVGRARVIFEGTAINISTQGQKHLGSALGSREYLEEYVGSKVEDWISQVVKLAEFAMSQLQACYAAIIFGLRHRWTYFLRTLLDIEDLFLFFYFKNTLLSTPEQYISLIILLYDTKLQNKKEAYLTIVTYITN